MNIFDNEVDSPKDTGQTDVVPLLDLSIPDQELIGNLSKSIKSAEDYWNDPKSHNLRSVRENNDKMYLGKHYDPRKLYDHNIPYQENQLFVGTETIIATVTNRISKAEVYPGNDNTASRQFAIDLEKTLFAHSEKHELNRLLDPTVRNLLLKRIGVVKLEFDKLTGDIVPRVIKPERLVVDKYAGMGKNPRFIAEQITETLQDLLAKFPSKKKAIMDDLGFTNMSQQRLQSEVTYYEVWFTYYENDKPWEGKASYFNKVMLEKSKTPHWNYQEEPEARSNFFDYPLKPYIPLNFINNGEHWIDYTTPFEQALESQIMLNRRGRQIMENADKANPTKVFASEAMTPEDAENLTGDPNQSIIVKGDSVANAYGVIPAQQLPSFVVQDKMDSRQLVHTILGTPPQLQGSSQNDNNTLGQDIMARDQAMGRQDAIVRAIDSFMHKYYRYLVQMMKVYYTDAKQYTAVDEDGTFMVVSMSADDIEDGIDVRVTAGSTLPMNKERMEAVALNLAKLGLIDPISLYEALRLPNPRQMYERLVKYKVDPTLLAQDVKNDDSDRDAWIDYKIIMGGQETDPRSDVTPEHIKTHQQQLMGDEFMEASPDRQQALLAHIQAENDALARRAELEQMAAPPPPAPPAPPVTMNGKPRQQDSQQIPPQPNPTRLEGMNSNFTQSPNLQNPSEVPTI
jgi:hypothetical protein